MSDESKDEKAALREFMEILYVDEAKSEKERLHDAFVKSFKSKYYMRRDDYTHNLDFEEFTECLECDLRVTPDFLKEASKEANKLKEAEKLGAALGWFLAMIDFGLAGKWGEESLKIEGKILSGVDSIVSDLKNLNKKVKHKFIKNRVMHIAKHKKHLSNERRKLIAKIAAKFA